MSVSVIVSVKGKTSYAPVGTEGEVREFVKWAKKSNPEFSLPYGVISSGSVETLHKNLVSLAKSTINSTPAHEDVLYSLLEATTEILDKEGTMEVT